MATGTPKIVKRKRRFHLDNRIDQILAFGPPGIRHEPADDDLLSSTQVAAWLGVSVQWLELGRSRGYGPDFEELAPHMIRYKFGNVRKRLKSRPTVSPEKGERRGACKIEHKPER